MINKTVIFNYRYGMDSNVGSIIISKMREFESKIEIEHEGKRLTTKSLLKLCSMGIKKGSKVTIYAEGIDEKEALEVISDSFSSCMSEEDWCEHEKMLIEEQECNENKLCRNSEEFDKQLEKIIEETMAKEEEFIIRKKRKKNSFLDKYLDLPINPLMVIGHPQVKNSIESFWEIMIYRINKKFGIKNLEWDIISELTKRIENTVECNSKKNNSVRFTNILGISDIYNSFHIPSPIVSQITEKFGKAYIISLKNTIRYQYSGEAIPPSYEEFIIEFNKNFNLPKISI